MSGGAYALMGMTFGVPVACTGKFDALSQFVEADLVEGFKLACSRQVADAELGRYPSSPWNC